MPCAEHLCNNSPDLCMCLLARPRTAIEARVAASSVALALRSCSHSSPCEVALHSSAPQLQRCCTKRSAHVLGDAFHSLSVRLFCTSGSRLHTALLCLVRQCCSLAGGVRSVILSLHDCMSLVSALVYLTLTARMTSLLIFSLSSTNVANSASYSSCPALHSPAQACSHLPQ